MKTCPDCGVEMIAGSRRDKINAAIASPESWVPSRPSKKLSLFLSQNGPPVPVVTYACPDCGRLVSYLNKP